MQLQVKTAARFAVKMRLNHASDGTVRMRTVRKPFRNALCLDLRPEAVGWYGTISNRRRHECKRHAGHSMPHRAVYEDAVIEWSDGSEAETRRKRNLE